MTSSLLHILYCAFCLLSAQNCYSPDNLPGVCINIQSCASFYRLLQTGEVGALGSLGAYIKKSLCGYDGVDLLVRNEIIFKQLYEICFAKLG